MKKQKSLNNKGFSLVELIIVIAIMAILVGVLAPSLLRYVEKTNVSADTQLADAVRTAVITAMMDPAVINAQKDDGAGNMVADKSEKTFTDAHKPANVELQTSLADAFLVSLNETLGFADSTTAADLQKGLIAKLKSTHGSGCAIIVQVVAGNNVKVTITQTDNTGKKDDIAASTGNDITVG